VAVDDALQALLALSDDDLEKIKFTLPSIVVSSTAVDADGFPTGTSGAGSNFDVKDESALTRGYLQKECWNKFNRNPQINTSVRGLTGRIVGMGFEATSAIAEIQEAIEETELDWRNRLYANWRPYVSRAVVEGELYLVLTCHENGFIEVDFMDPSVLSGGGDDDTGIIFHPRKTILPVFYIVDRNGEKEHIPSVYVAYDPNLVNDVAGHDSYDKRLQSGSRDRKTRFKSIGGFKRFVLGWDRGFCTRRAISYLRTTLEWLNYYEDLKKYEIDHKKAIGAYAWEFSFEDIKAFRLWANLTPEEKKATAVMAPILPGTRLFLPPGMKLTPRSPQIPSISNSDTDILQMVISGLNEASDVTTGTVGGTYASVKASRGPMADRTQDEVCWFDNFYRFDFWGSIFHLKHKLIGFPEFFEVEEAVGFKDKEPVMKKVKRRPERLIETSYPMSEIVDLNQRTQAILGSKHGPMPESLGLPPSKAASMLGIGGYGRMRLRKATEDHQYPPLAYSIDADRADAIQEQAEGEQPKVKNKPKNDSEKVKAKKSS
jgi:hypothetical protein